MINDSDFIGKKFNKLTVLKYSRSDKKNRYYLFQCECGNLKEYTKYEVENNRAKGCGCGTRGTGHHQFVDLSGKKVGKWRVVEHAEFRKNRAFWKCVCECRS